MLSASYKRKIAHLPFTHPLTILTGNEVISEISTHSKHELRIDMEDFEGQTRYAKYSVFSVGDEASEFVLKVQGYSGDAGIIFYYQRCKQAIETGVNLIETRLG
jgi:hypothetical protein